jgi:DNA-binding LacI/PurR family transcriptional regulator
MNIAEFAKTLHLSTGTVSRALNDRAEVSAETRRMVLEKAQELGYTRNPNARRLATGHNSLIRLECPYQANILSDRYLVEMARAVEEAADEHGYDLLLHLGTRQREGGAQAVDGLVVVAAQETTAADLKRLTGDSRAPTVVIVEGDPLDFPHASYVCLDTVSGVREALQRLSELGHRRIGYIGSGWPSRQLRSALPSLIAEAD